MSIPAFSVRNNVLVNMLMLVVLFSGLAFAFTLTREMFPESRPDKLTIMAFHPGVQPEELEKAITIKVEEAVRDVEGVEKVDSQVSEGLSITILTLLNEVKNADVVLQEIKNEIDALEDLPDDLEKITVNKVLPRLPVISIALFGNGDEVALKRAVRDLRDELLSLEGISEIELTGTRDDEISVDIQPDKLLEFNVTFAEVAGAIRNSNLDVSGGQLKGNRASVAVRTVGEKTRGEDLKDLVVRSQPDGRKIVVSDVATVRDSFVETDLETLFNGKTGVNVVAYAARNQDAIRISSQVKAFIAGKRGDDFKPSWSESGAIGGLLGKPDLQKIYDDSRAKPFDHSFEYALHTDVARFVEGRLDLLTRNGKVGLILVLISLNLFLNWRVALWAAVGLVVSFLGTFVVMWLLGASINLLSMFGLIIVLGIIVDDAIVIGENIYRHVEEGMPPMQAAVKGAEEVMWPVTIAILTTIGAFAPMFFIKGQIGDFMRQLPIVVIAALSISLLEALVILPAHLSRMPARKRKQNADGSASHPHSQTGRSFFDRLSHWQDAIMTNFLMKPYEWFLRLALRWRYVTIAAAVSCLVMSIGLVAGGIVEYRFVQKMDSESMICNLEMPVGTSVENLREQLQLLTDYIVNKELFPEVVNVQTMIARQYDVTGAGAVGLLDQSHLGQLVLEICPADERTRSSEELLNKFRKYSLEALSGLNSVKWQEMNGGPGGNDIEIKISGGDSEQLPIVMDEIKQILAGFDGVFDLDDNMDRGKRELRLRLRDAARPTGVTVGMLGSHVRAAMFGAEARRLTRDREDVKIMVRYPEEFRENAWNLESMWIPTSNAATGRNWVPISEIADVESAPSYSTIHRSRQQRAMTLFGAVDRAVTEPGVIIDQVRKQIPEVEARYPGVRVDFLGQSEEMAKAFGGLRLAFPVALLLIYAMLAGLFKSYVQPLVVMSAIPFGILGAIIGHWITDNPLTILSQIGMVALTGILVNDSLVLVDFINKRQEAGLSPFEASVEGARLRLRAILLTTLTTVAGLTPLMFETSFQAKFLIPMAVTLTFGLIFATALTLIIVPSLNLIWWDVKSLVGSRFAATIVSEEAVAVG